MASKEEYVTDLFDMYFGGSVERAFFNKEEVGMAIIGGKVVFNRALYHLSISDDAVRFTARGGNFSDDSPKDQMMLKCYKQDCDGSKVNQYDLEFEPSSVEPNLGSGEVNGTFKVTHIFSGLSVEGSWVQSADAIQSITYRDIKVTDVIYPVIPASGGTVYPFIYYTAVMVAIYESGREETSTYEFSTSDVSYMEGSTPETHVTLDYTNGSVHAESLGTNRYDTEFPIAEISLLRATDFNGEEIEWKDHVPLQVSQAKNQPSYNGTSYDVSAVVPQDGGTISSSEQTITIYIDAWVTTKYKWDSGAESSENEAHTVYIRTSIGTLSSMSASGSQDVTLSIPQNGTSDRDITIRVYSTAAGYDKTFTITQEAFVEVEAWQVPFISGSVSVGEIAADGSGALLNATIIQYKKKGDTITQTYYPSITSLVGTSVSGTGFSYSNGVVYANSMGTTQYSSGRKVYTITGFKVSGGDGNTYTLSLSSSLEVWQEANVFEFVEYGDYVLSLSASPSEGISASGGTSTITASAQIEKIYEWTSGEGRDTQLSDSNANLKPNAGTISPSSINGTDQTATLTLEENESNEVKEVTVTLYVGNASTSIPVYQNKAVLVFTPKQGSSFEMAYNSKSFSIAYECKVNNTAVKPTVEVSGSNIKGYTVSQSTSSPYPWVILVTLEDVNSGNNQLVYTVKVTHPNDSSLTDTVTVTHKTMAADKPSFMNTVYAESNGWYLGQMKIASAVINSTSVNIYSIVAAKAGEITSNSTLTWQFTSNYLVGNPNGSGLTPYEEPKEYTSSQIVAAGTTTNVSGTTINGILIVSGSPERFIDLSETFVFTAT